jgi:3-oxoacyl-[acyl-carrier-protein] synthase II
MSSREAVITGLASVSPFGIGRGPLAPAAVELQAITRWPTDGARYAHQVPAFQPGQVVPGLKTRRMDRLSVWALVAANLALEDANLRAPDLPADRAGVTFGTAFGCIELTESFMVSIERNGHAKADPILFPETLANLPASHVARHCGFRGPNVTLSRGLMSGEMALVDAAGQIEAGEASMIVVLAGDVVSRSLFAWYEAAGRLAPECRRDDVDTSRHGSFVPGEGVAAVILESRAYAAERGARAYAVVAGSVMERATDDGWAEFVGRVERVGGGNAAPRFVVAGPGVPTPSWNDDVLTVSPHRECGMFSGGALLGLSLAFGARPAPGPGHALLLAAGRQRAGILLALGEPPA